MPRTDEQIAEYLSYYAQQGQRQWAIDTLVRTEGKTAEEIMHIWRVARAKRAAQSRTPKPKYSDKFLADIEADKAAGMTYKDLADKYKIPLKTVNSIMNIICQRKKKAAPPREPEAYPGQINDDEPEPIVETDVKVFIPGELPTDEVIELDVPEPEKISYKKPDIIEPPQNVWFAIRDELRYFALGLFGAGTEVIEESVSAKYHDMSITVKTADGNYICFSVGKEKGKTAEED